MYLQEDKSFACLSELEKRAEAEIKAAWKSLILFLIADKQTTSAERHGIKRGAEEINKSCYFKNALNLKWNSQLHYFEKEFCFCSHRTL